MRRGVVVAGAAPRRRAREPLSGRPDPPDEAEERHCFEVVSERLAGSMTSGGEPRPEDGS